MIRRPFLAVGAALLAAALPLAVAPGASAVAGAGAGAGRGAGGTLAASGPVTIGVISMSPSYARPGQTIKMVGTLRNNTSAPMTGITVQLEGSSSPLESRAFLEEFAAGTYVPPGLTVIPQATSKTMTLAAGASTRWTISLPADSLRLNCFGVYPLTASVNGDPAAGPAIAPVALPFWPSRQGGCLRPNPEPISWIWPLIDQPRQGACPALFDTSLTDSLGKDGRLGGLLGAAVASGKAAKITYAIDPALLDNVRTMTAQFTVGENSQCAGARPHAAIAAARTWLASLTGLTTGQPVLFTPYADVDVAALTQHGLSSDLNLAFRQGQRVARADLPGSFGGGGTSGAAPAGRDATATPLGSLAWPADGYASHPVLENLASLQITTVILDSSTMPADQLVPYTPGAVTRTPSGVLATPTNVLLSDHRLTALLGSSQASSRQPSSIFAVRQLFLAETAMISAESPSTTRSVLVAPPRHWNPAPDLAAGLLADTASAPWLLPSTPADLLKLRPDQLTHRPPAAPSGQQLSGPLMRELVKLDGTVGLLESLTPGNPNLALYRALFAAESSAWRGRNTAPQAWTLLRQASDYAADQLGKLSVGGARKVILGGTTGSVLISIYNEQTNPVQLLIQVSPDNASIKMARTELVTVPAGSGRSPGSVKTIKLPVQAAQDGSARVRISLASPSGVALPGRTLVIQVQATQFGTLTLIICAAALAVFVLASAFRAIRHGRAALPSPAAGGQEPGGRVPDDDRTGMAQTDFPGEDAGSVDAERSAMTAAAPGSHGPGPRVRGQWPTGGSQ